MVLPGISVILCSASQAVNGKVTAPNGRYVPLDDKFYFVVEAVPRPKNRNELHVVSAFIGYKKEASQVADVRKLPGLTSENELESTFNENISSENGDVNVDFTYLGDSALYKEKKSM